MNRPDRPDLAPFAALIARARPSAAALETLSEGLELLRDAFGCDVTPRTLRMVTELTRSRGPLAPEALAERLGAIVPALRALPGVRSARLVAGARGAAVFGVRLTWWARNTSPGEPLSEARRILAALAPPGVDCELLEVTA